VKDNVMTDDQNDKKPWYEGVTPYMWLVLLIASLGWVFDIFEGQIYVATMKDIMGDLLPKGTLDGTRDFFNNIALAFFLVGGALGGVLFGIVSDKIGRTRTMILTILMYSLFTCLTAFAQNWWQVIILRFLVAMGTGGEWAVASAMVAEVFPKRARASSLGIFHASSVLGTLLAVLVGATVVPHYGWRWAFVLGALPAVLTLWIRWKLREPERWKEARDRAAADTSQKPGRILDLFAPDLVRNTVVGLLLATIGLATFWGVHIYGRELLRMIVEREYLADAQPEIQRAVGETRRAVDEVLRTGTGPIEPAQLDRQLQTLRPETQDVLAEILGDREGPILRRDVRSLPDMVGKKLRGRVLDGLSKSQTASLKRWEMLGMFLVTAGGGLGLLSFGPICERIGRRGTFLLFHVGGLASGLIVFLGMSNASAAMLCVALPPFGYLTLGMHAGYAIYFPELFPTRLRGTGAGFCFNGGRFLAASILILRGWMRNDQGLGLSLESTASILSLLFLLGILILLAAPETKGRDLPT
jgi:MFS family permease